MPNSIVRRLMKKSPKTLDYLKESMGILTEADEDEDEENSEEIGTEDTLDGEEDASTEETGEESTASPSIRRPKFPDEEPEDEEESEQDPHSLKAEIEKEKEENVNPLDNPYAVNFTLGDRVTLTYSNGTVTDLEATIEGYDKEGFYRIQLDSGMAINGLTDLALASLVQGQKESVCVCGETHFVTEGRYVVCDTCGRRIRESMDHLTQIDKSRPKGKRMIRSEAHPISTAARPNIDIGESIKNPFNKQSIREESDSSIDTFNKLESLTGDFWTNIDELVEDIESLGYEVVEKNREYVVVSSEEDYQMKIPLGGTFRSMTLDFDRAKIL